MNKVWSSYHNYCYWLKIINFVQKLTILQLDFIEHYVCSNVSVIHIDDINVAYFILKKIIGVNNIKIVFISH